MDQNAQIPLSGAQLVTDYQSAFIAMTMAETAKYEAQRSETALMRELAAISDNAYLNPGKIAGGTQGDIAHNSLDAHIKKIQAEQLQTLQAEQLSQLMAQDQAAYHRRKVTVTVVTKAPDAIETVWFDKTNGYRTATSKRLRITGLIDQVLLDQNSLLVIPTFRSRLFNSGLVSYAVYIIDPDTLTPVVNITLG